MFGGPGKMILHTFAVFAFVSGNFCGVSTQNVGDMEIVAEWVKIEFDWDSEAQKNHAIADGTYIPNNNLASGIKVHKDVVYVTVPRWLPGVPSTMNTLTFKDGKPLLKPFPNWDMQNLDDCNAFQFSMSMEIVPHTDEMWIIDVGRRNIWQENPVNNCPPTLRILDLNTKEIKHTYTFPNEVLSHTTNFVNDIVVDPERGFAYLTDVGQSAAGSNGGLVFYDRNQNIARRSEHQSMTAEVNRDDGSYDITINGKPFEMPFFIDGIGLTTDKNTAFFCPLGGVHLHQVQTSSLRACDQNVCALTDSQVKDMGEKVSESDGIVWGHRSLYFAALGLNAIYRWDHQADMEEQGVNELWQVNMTKQELVKQDNEKLIWGDTFAFDDKGWLWVTADRIALFANGQLDYSGASGPNFRIAKIYVNDKSYLMPEDNSSQRSSLSIILAIISCILAVFIMSRC